MKPNNTGDVRPCGEYRALNALTTPERYTLPNIQDCTPFVNGCVLFSHIDLVTAYHQTPVELTEVTKTAITTMFELFQCCSMPLTMQNAVKTFQHFNDEVVRGIAFSFTYLDDFAVSSVGADMYKVHLFALFQRL